MLSSRNRIVVTENTDFPPSPDNIEKIAYIDFDGTMSDSHCVDYLIVINRNYRNPVAFFWWRILLQLKAPLFYLLYKTSAGLFDKYYCRHYQGLSQKRINTIVRDQVIPFVKSRIFPQAETEIRKLRADGYHIVIVSGTPKHIIEPVAKALGAHACIATELETKSGVFTGGIQGNSVNAEDKLKAIQQYQRHNGIFPKHIVAYGNSQWDIPMLNFAQQAYVVNPDKRLAKWSGEFLHQSVHWTLEKIPFRFYFLYAFLRPFMQHWEGLPHIARDQGVIIIANHSSYLDHYIIGLTVMCRYKRRVRFLAKKEHFDTRFQKWIHKQLGAFPIDRARGGKDGLQSVVKLLQQGEIVLMYPEGTRSLDGKLQPFKPGVLYTHFHSRCQIVPAGIRGAYEILPRDKLIPRPGRITLKFGRSISLIKQQGVSSIPRGQDREAILENLQQRVAKLAQ